MDIFGDNYLNVRNTYLIPLVNYGITRAKVEYWSFKDIISRNVISLNKLTGKSFEIEISKDDFYKALHCDIELLMNKSIIQYSDCVKSAINSPCWSFVTLYYFTFFNATCFFRFLNKGFIYLTHEQKTRFEAFSLAVYSSPISLDSGNYFFNYKEENSAGNIVLTLSFKGESVHKLNWIQLEATFREFLPKCDRDETLIYAFLLSIFSTFKTDFPSSLRNKLNYNVESSILDLTSQISHIDLASLNSKFVKGLFSLKKEINNTNQVNATAYLGIYLYNYNMTLYQEYIERSKYGKDFYKERTKYLKDNGIKFM